MEKEKVIKLLCRLHEAMQGITRIPTTSGYEALIRDRVDGFFDSQTLHKQDLIDRLTEALDWLEDANDQIRTQ